MLWIRGFLFTVLVPGTIAVWVPHWLLGDSSLEPGFWQIGWILVAAGTLAALSAFFEFLAAGGTPMIFFARGLRFAVGEEPKALVRGGLFRYSRNPMYLSVLSIVWGQALVFRSAALVVYGAALLVLFHLVVTQIEEPHLRRREGAKFDDYCRRVPRWIGVPRT
ncbi:MAG TPA: isoprenylcysteine carboxylmethyltransferase family protein [Bryobacteraceae bacterium]